MIMAHLKRYVMPKAWPVPVKAETFIIRPSPGPHALKVSMPLQVLLREELGVASTAAEARKILHEGKILVDKIVRKKPKFPVGPMDVIEIPDIGEAYRVGFNKTGITIEKIKTTDAKSKLCMITGKTILSGAKVQLNLHDGSNIILDKGKDDYKVRDSVIVSLPKKEIIKHFKLKVGNPAIIFSGKNRGISGTISEIKERKTMTEKSTAIIKSGDKMISTLREYIFVGENSGKVKE